MAKSRQIQKKRSSLFIRLFVVTVAFYLLFLLVQTQIEISQKKAEITLVDNKIELAQSLINEQRRIMGAQTEAEYIERIARERLGYASAGERVFVDVNANQ